MKDPGTPISLFSFQAIITSLTGIMIFVILVISFQMIETVQQASQAPKTSPEYEALNRRLAELQAKLQQLNQQDAPIPDEWLEILELSPTEIIAMKEQERDRLAFLQRKERDLQKLLENAQDRLKASQARLEELEQEIVQLGKVLDEPVRKCQDEEAELEKKLAKLMKEIEMLKEEERNLVNAIAEKRKKLHFAFVGERTHTPILVECKGDSFRAGVYLSSDIRDFHGGSFGGNLDDLCKWLKGFDFSRYYPVLLYREAAIRRSHEIEEKIHSLGNGIRIGRDPIPKDAHVF